MKTILVPTDFSETATNAICYAAELAKWTKAKLLLLHVYHLPLQVLEVPYTITQETFALEEDTNHKMELIIKNIKKNQGKELIIEHVSIPGSATDEIACTAKEKNIDLIIMGTNGINHIGFWGSNTVQVLKHTQCPVLVIPSNAKFQALDKIVFAFDNLEIKNGEVFSPLIELASVFDSEVMIFHQQEDDFPATINTVVERIKLKHTFEKLKCSFWFSEKKNLTDAINEVTIKNNAVMIAMIKRKHSFFQRFFNASKTELMTLYTQFPLLVLHI